MALRLGGSYLFSVQAPESQGGQMYYSTGQYEEIDAPRHLVFGDYFADSGGNIVPVEQRGMAQGFPAQPRVIPDLTPHAGGTVMTIRHPGWQPGGMDESLDKLERILATL